jgi:hypothetical protein
MKLGAEENNQMEWNKSIIRQPFTRTNNKCRLIVKDRSVFNQCPKLHSLSLSDLDSERNMKIKYVVLI